MKHTFTAVKILIFTLCLFICDDVRSQDLDINGAIQINASILLGNQNQTVNVGVFAFGTVSIGKVSGEIAYGVDLYALNKRHTIAKRGIAFRTEYYFLAGYGQNANLLGSSISELSNGYFYDSYFETYFTGLGFGSTKDLLPGSLKSYGIRQGKMIVRHSGPNYNAHILFQNDFTIRNLFYGEGTDYATTGFLKGGFSFVDEGLIKYHFGLAGALFTAQPDYQSLARNPKNSDDGRKNVWYTKGPYPDLFYANFYAFGNVQNDSYSGALSIGRSSQQLGAWIQNKLHDGFGMNPRFPWDTSQKSKWFIELEGGINYNFQDEN